MKQRFRESLVRAKRALPSAIVQLAGARVLVFRADPKSRATDPPDTLTLTMPSSAVASPASSPDASLVIDNMTISSLVDDAVSSAKSAVADAPFAMSFWRRRRAASFPLLRPALLCSALLSLSSTR